MTKRKVNAYTIEAQRIVEIVKELKALPHKPNLKQSTRRAPNRRLDNVEELALKQFLNHMDSIGFGIRKEMVQYGIIPANFWNFNKCGVCLIWTKKGREVFIPYLNMETIRLISDYITLIIIISSQNLIEEWFTDLLAGYLVARLETAYAGALFKGELLKTQAAQAAYNSRKLGSRKILLAGGPVYAKDARQVLPALIKFTQKKLQPVYIFKGNHRPLSRVPKALPVCTRGFIRKAMGLITQVGKKRVAKMKAYAVAKRPRSATPEEDQIEGALPIDSPRE
ncbi:hypothetical protein V2W45_1471114 [Cenococcum geophilum]